MWRMPCRSLRRNMMIFCTTSLIHLDFRMRLRICLFRIRRLQPRRYLLVSVRCLIAGFDQELLKISISYCVLYECSTNLRSVNADGLNEGFMLTLLGTPSDSGWSLNTVPRTCRPVGYVYLTRGFPMFSTSTVSCVIYKANLTQLMFILSCFD